MNLRLSPSVGGRLLRVSHLSAVVSGVGAVTRSSSTPDVVGLVSGSSAGLNQGRNFPQGGRSLAVAVVRCQTSTLHQSYQRSGEEAGEPERHLVNGLVDLIFAV